MKKLKDLFKFEYEFFDKKDYSYNYSYFMVRIFYDEKFIGSTKFLLLKEYDLWVADYRLSSFAKYFSLDNEDIVLLSIDYIKSLGYTVDESSIPFFENEDEDEEI